MGLHRDVKMKLYGHPLSPFSRVAELTGLINKQDFEFQHVKLFEKEQHQDWFLKINPQHKVPVLIDQNETITESVVIAQYLCNKLGGTELYPVDAKEKARIDEAIVDVQTVNFLFIPLTRIFGLPEKLDDEKKFVDSMNQFAKRRLQTTGFLLGKLT